LRAIWKARGEGNLCIPSWNRPSNSGKKGNKGQCGEHDSGGKPLIGERKKGGGREGNSKEVENKER